MRVVAVPSSTRCLSSFFGRFFDPSVLAQQVADIEVALLDELAAAIAAGTYDQVLAGIR